MVVTDDSDLAERLTITRVHGGKPKYQHRIVGGNFRLDALQAAVLRVKLKHLAEWTRTRRENADRYRSLFKEMRLLDRVLLPSDSAGHIYNQFVVRLPNRERLRDFLREHNIETEVYYPIPLHLQECFAELGYRVGDFPCAEAAAQDSLALPIYPELSAEQQRHVVRQIANFYQ